MEIKKDSKVLPEVAEGAKKAARLSNQADTSISELMPRISRSLLPWRLGQPVNCEKVDIFADNEGDGSKLDRKARLLGEAPGMTRSSRTRGFYANRE